MSDRSFKRLAHPRAQAARGGSASRKAACTCNECAKLDIHHPGEGVQLALGLGDLNRVAARPEQLS